MIIDGIEVSDFKAALYFSWKHDLLQINDPDILREWVDCFLDGIAVASREQKAEYARRMLELQCEGNRKAAREAGIPDHAGSAEWIEFWRER